MTEWISHELDQIGNPAELEIAPRRGNGTLRNPVTIGAFPHGARAERPRPLAQTYPQRDGRQPQAPGHRLRGDAVAALSVKLTSEEIQQLEDAYPPHPIIGFV